jgi:hypothetical protein
MKKTYTQLKAALEVRWGEAGSPAHSTKIIISDLDRAIAGRLSEKQEDALLTEALDALQHWAKRGAPLSAAERQLLKPTK